MKKSFVLTAVLLGICLPVSVNADWKDDIGYTALMARIGGGLEDGTGVQVGISEAFVGGQYMPDVTNAQFTGKTITNVTGSHSGSSTHATSVARLFFGNTTSISGGVTQVYAYSADDWALNVSGYSTSTDPTAPQFQVMNNSWVDRASSSTTAAEATAILHHIDYMVNTFDTTIVGGTDNSGGLPKLLAPSYNTITVGRTNGTHASGTTSFYGAGRSKPDIVAPATTTSSSTPMVSSAATLLYQKGMGTDAVRSETLRAVLMAGATKEEFPDWDHTSTRPLDEVFGAGELNVDNSYSILEGGQFAGSTSQPVSLIGEDGWDYQAGINPSDPIYYDFEIVDGMRWEDFSVILAWNMDIIDTDGSGTFSPLENLANLDLRLYDSTDSFLNSVVDLSVSTIDNVEHLYIGRLESGRYTLEVTADQSQDFGIAWRSNLSAVPEPNSLAFLAIAASALTFRRKRNT